MMEFDLVVVDACGANVSKYDNVDYLRENPSFPLSICPSEFISTIVKSRVLAFLCPSSCPHYVNLIFSLYLVIIMLIL